MEEREVPGRNGSIPIRIYTDPTNRTPHPTLVYLHGGGWVVGGLDECDGVCSYICQHGGVTVVSVDYRMAPENRFPAAVEDSFDAVSWVADNAAKLGGIPEKLAVAGDSAGGNLAAVVCQLARDAGGPNLSKQILIYPCLAPGDHAKHPSRLHFGKDDAFLSEAALDYMVELYRRGPNDESDWRFWPSLNENLADLPATYIITAEYDMLRDEARAYGDALSNAGSAAEYHEYSGTIHGFFCFAGSIAPGRDALRDLSDNLRDW